MSLLCAIYVKESHSDFSVTCQDGSDLKIVTHQFQNGHLRYDLHDTGGQLSNTFVISSEGHLSNLQVDHCFVYVMCKLSTIDGDTNFLVYYVKILSDF